MKLFRWFVLLKNDPAGFYAPVTVGRFLVGFSDVPNTPYLSPVWADADPTLYQRKGARFIVSELRRVGYNVHALPFFLLQILQRIRARKVNPWGKR